MLVLTRKVGEEIVLSTDVTIKVLSSHEGRVRIGIQAPSHIRVFRKEVYDKIKETTDGTEERDGDRP